jgi:D-glycerate 3-kinase
VHPLLATRGVPGTHEPDLLARTLVELAAASPRRPARMPRFDKGRDTRVAPLHWRCVAKPPRLIVLEGWCVGVPAQSSTALQPALNALERNADRDGRWRRWVNARLAGDYAKQWARLDALILLEAPGFATVTRWRDEQERALRARGAPHAMDAATLHDFLMHYERLSRHALRALPARADIRLVLRADHSVRRIAAG